MTNSAEAPSPKGGSTKLTPRQVNVLPYLLNTTSVEEAVKQSGKSRSTLQRWLRDPEFLRELALQQQQIIKEVRDKLTAYMMLAVDVLGELLESDSESVRRQAARDLLTIGFNAEKHFELVRRLRELEEAVDLNTEVGSLR